MQSQALSCIYWLQLILTQFVPTDFIDYTVYIMANGIYMDIATKHAVCEICVVQDRVKPLQAHGTRVKSGR